jgi:hypothetical protein
LRWQEPCGFVSSDSDSGDLALLKNLNAAFFVEAFLIAMID